MSIPNVQLVPVQSEVESPQPESISPPTLHPLSSFATNLYWIFWKGISRIPNKTCNFILVTNPILKL
jgi:hypothetical protein